MDKHDRPYKCMEPGCDKIQGFTYSGGLLRHERRPGRDVGGGDRPASAVPPPEPEIDPIPF